MPSSQRFLVLDSLRGLMLVLIAVNHYGGPIADYLLEQPLGFVTAAEGFIFLAGLMVGLLYSSKMASDPYSTTLKLLRRALKIYVYHLVTLLLIVAIAQLVPLYAASWQAWLGDYSSTPWLSLGAALSLLYRPDHLDILPLYATFFIGAPLVLWAFAKGYSKVVLSVSLLLYLLAPFGLVEFYRELLPSAAHLSRGYFNPFSWQFLFVLGVYLGTRQRQNTLALSFRRRYLVSAGVLALLAFVVRELQRFGPLGDVQLISVLVSRSYLSPLRLLNFFLLAYLLVALVRVRPGWFRQPWLVLLGQHSLYVFSFHIVALYLLAPFRGSFNTALESVLFALSLSVPALAHRAWSQHQLSQRLSRASP